MAVKENTDTKKKKKKKERKNKNTDRTQTKLNAPHVRYNIKMLFQELIIREKDLRRNFREKRTKPDKPDLTKK